MSLENTDQVHGRQMVILEDEDGGNIKASNPLPISVNGSSGNATEVVTNPNTTKNELLVNLQGHECLDNTTSTPLGIDGVFTGVAWQDTKDYGILSINVLSDQNSATDGLDVQWSDNGTDVHDHDYFTILANKPKTFTFGPAQRYYRVVYTNGGVAQTSFRLTSMLRRCYVKPSSHRITDSIVGQDDAELVKAINTGEDDYGVFQNVKVDSTGRMKVVSQPYTYSIAEGTIPNHVPVRRFGHNPNSGTSLETVGTTSTLYTYLTSAELLEVVSTDANDDMGDTGMNSVFIQGLDANYTIQSEIVELDGTTNVYTTKSYLRILAAYGFSVGSSAGNEGIITISNNAGTNILGTIPIGEGRWNSAIMTVPAGYTMYITKWYGSENSKKGSDVTLWKREFGNGGWQMIRLYTIIDDVFENEIQLPLEFTEKTDVEIRVKALEAGANVAGGMYGWMEN